jgi:hypothetical protein
MANAADTLRLLLAAVQDGKLTPDSAKRWARRAAAGERITPVVTVMASMPSREHYGPKAMAQLQRELVDVLAGTGAVATDADLAEYEALWPDDPEVAREAQIRAAVRQVDELTDDQIFRILFDTGET